MNDDWAISACGLSGAKGYRRLIIIDGVVFVHYMASKSYFLNMIVILDHIRILCTYIWLNLRQKLGFIVKDCSAKKWENLNAP